MQGGEIQHESLAERTGCILDMKLGALYTVMVLPHRWSWDEFG